MNEDPKDFQARTYQDETMKEAELSFFSSDFIAENESVGETYVPIETANENATFYLASLPSVVLWKESISPTFLVHFPLLGRLLHFLIFFLVFST